MKKKSYKTNLRKFWKFFWEEDSFLSLILNIIVAFVLMKYLIYPIIGLVLSTTHPIVAVVSQSMEHPGTFDSWWNQHEPIYSELNISEDEFRDFPYKNGFNTGDIMVLKGKKTEKIEVGDVLVFNGNKDYPIIHRIVDIYVEDGKTYFKTKGDNNLGFGEYELKIPLDKVIGYDKYSRSSIAILRVPYVGYIKMGAVCGIDLLPFVQIMPELNSKCSVYSKFMLCMGWAKSCENR
jgi:hypothetical protein